tara:strand:- start:229 stop:1257 length:1029 start_codon:yes stop_codon:yes gene_type:complete
MSYEISLIIFSAINIFLIIFFKNFKILLDNPEHGGHKSKLNQGIPLTGGTYFLLSIFLIIFNDQSSIVPNIYFIFFLLIFILGAFSDSIKNMTPTLRLIIQITIILSCIYLMDIKINKTSLTILDLFLSNFFFNLFFTTFCLLVLLNGSNFCDGVNANVVGYYLIVFFGLAYLTNDQTNLNNLILIILCLSIFYVSNLLNYSFLGDNGVYFISFFSGVYLINFINFESSLNPLIAINLLWYPAYENLFSIVRRMIKKIKVDHADTLHLHTLFKKYLSFKYKKINNLNSISGFIFNLYNLISISLSLYFIDSSYILLLIIIINLITYNFVYLVLKNLLKNKPL